MDDFYTLLSSTLIILGILIPWLISMKKKVSKVNRDHKLLQRKYRSSSLKINFVELNTINNIVNRVLDETHIDRFLLLTAVNGKEDFNFCSAIWEQHRESNGFQLSTGATSKYIDLKNDPHYVQMLKSIEKIQPSYFVVEKMEPSMLQSIYKAEQVLFSMVCFVARIQIDGDNDKLVYCSWATHENKTFDKNLQLKLWGATKKIQNLIDKSYE